MSVNRRGTISIASASGMTTFSVMWPTHSSSMTITGTRYSSARLKASKVKSNVEKSVALDPDNIDARIFLAQFLMNAPPIAGGDPERGRAEVDEIVARDPKRGNLLRAEVLLREDKFDEAMAAFDAAIAADLPSAEALRGQSASFVSTQIYDRNGHLLHEIVMDPFLEVGNHLGRREIGLLDLLGR